MQAQDVMTQYVYSVAPDDTVAQAVRLMLQEQISGVPVLDNGRLVGMLTEGDLLRRTETATERRRPRWLEFLLGPGQLADEYVHTHGRKVREIMTPDPIAVAEETPLQAVVMLMERKGVKRVPVVRGDAVVGIVSRANLLHALARLSAEAGPSKTSDKTIRDQIFSELARQNWAPTGTLEVIVRDGVVDLWGSILDERERQALVVAAENVPGVKKVNDHVAWIEPMSGMVMPPPAEANRKKAV